MSGFLTSVDPAAIAALVSGGEAFAKWLYHHVTGDKDSDSAKEAIGKLKDKLVDAAQIAALAELQKLATDMGLMLATTELALAAEKMRLAIKEAETSPTVPRLEGFELSMIDRRAFHANVFHGQRYLPAKRPWSKVTGVCLHQTACWMGERPERYDAIAVHFVVTRGGKVLRMAEMDEVLIHGNGWNNQTVGIEIDGAYAGVEGDPRTFWDDPSTPVHEQPQHVTPVAMDAARSLVRWIVAEVANRGGRVGVLVAHRQASNSRRDDPGSAIWQQVALPLHAELGLHDGGVGFKLDDGYAIPEAWDPRCVGIRY